jgi:hypothetical protein
MGVGRREYKNVLGKLFIMDKDEDGIIMYTQIWTI